MNNEVEAFPGELKNSEKKMNDFVALSHIPQPLSKSAYTLSAAKVEIEIKRVSRIKC